MQKNFYFLDTTLGVFILNPPSISPQSVIFRFLDGALDYKFLVTHILLIFKIYLYKATENKDLNFYILKNYLTKIRDFESNLKSSDKYNKKWAVTISYNVSQKIK